MRIGLVTCGNLDTLTGGYLYDRCLVDHLKKKGHRVDIVSLPRRPYPFGFVHNFSPGLIHKLSRPNRDVILEDALCHPCLFLANRQIKRKSRTAVVGLVHQVTADQPRPLLDKWLHRQIERLFFRSVDGLIFNSDHTAQTVWRLTGDRQPAVTATPGGDRLGHIASAARITARAKASGPLRLVSVANLLPNKGIDKLIAALASVPREQWHLTVAGSLEMDRAHADKVRNLIGQKKLSGRVRLAGVLDGEDLAALLAQSHLFILPFSHESFGIAYLEAMAFGLPAIGSTRGGASQIISHGVNGFLLSPRDSQGLARHVTALAKNRAGLGRMGSAAWNTFLRHPPWAHSMQTAGRFLETMAFLFSDTEKQ